ncbi:MAG: hypothetical protein RLN70_03710, partial [Rhodospirillaceae bacterium]
MSGLLNEFHGQKQAALGNYDALAQDSENRRISMLRLIAGGYHRLGQSEKATEIVERYQEANGPSPTIAAFADSRSFARELEPAAGMAEALFAGAEMLLRTRPNDYRAQLAIAYAQMALHLDSDMIIARRFVGITLAARGHLEESNAILSAVGDDEPGHLEAQMQIAENLTRMEREEDALAALRSTARSHGEWP